MTSPGAGSTFGRSVSARSRENCSSDGTATFDNTPYAFTTSDHGVHTFSATLKTAGAQSLTAAASGVGHVDQTGITVTPGAAFPPRAGIRSGSDIQGARTHRAEQPLVPGQGEEIDVRLGHINR